MTEFRIISHVVNGIRNKRRFHMVSVHVVEGTEHGLGCGCGRRVMVHDVVNFATIIHDSFYDFGFYVICVRLV